MNILITAGGTSERIDDVRTIGNTATGRLGRLVAECFLEDAGNRVTYLCPRGADRPDSPRARILPVGDVQSLRDAVEREMRAVPYDAVVHSMAVSDYTVNRAVSCEELTKRLAAAVRGAVPERKDLEERIRSALLEGGGPQPGKISSDIDHLFLCLEKTPKIIGLFKKLRPETVLVGFKLLSGVEEPVLLRAAESLMERNGCDFVLANDLRGIGETRHEAILLGSDRSVRRLGTRQQIARAIEESVTRKVGEGKKK